MTDCPFDPEKFDPMAPGMIADPFDELARAHEDEPVFYMKTFGMWCVTRYEDVKKVMSDPITYSSKDMVRVWEPPPETRDQLPDGHPMEGAPVTTDPPRHTEIRRLVQKAFTPRVIMEREPSIREAANHLIDGFVDDGEVDLVRAYTSEIPPWVVTQLLGVPEKDTAQFRQWAIDAHDLAFSPPDLGPDGVLELSRKLVPFDAYIRQLIEERREEPREDLTSYLVHAESDEGDPKLTPKELMGVIVSMVTAGSDTTSTLIGHAVYLMLTEGGCWDEVRADRSLIPGLIEEAMRLLSPARAMRRTTTRPSTIAGVEIPEGATLHLHLASGNRDEKVFADPTAVDPRRPNASRHLGFGIGPHFCLGAALARLESRVALETLMDRISGLALAEQRELRDEDYIRNAFIPSLQRLDVRWNVNELAGAS